MYADEIKALVVSALLPKLAAGEVIGSEIRFGEGRYRADLVIASPSRLSAFEIKGPKDNLDKLSEQAKGYASLFLDFSVVTDSTWLEAVRLQVPQSTGLYIWRGPQLQTVRRPRPKLRLSPDAALSWLRIDDLRELLRLQGRPSSGHYAMLAEEVLAHIPVSILTSFALKSVYDRIHPRHKLFLNEMGRAVTLDDIFMLTLNDRVIGSCEALVESGGN